MKKHIYTAYLLTLIILSSAFFPGHKAQSQNEGKNKIKVIVTADYLAGDEKVNTVKLWDNVRIIQMGILIFSRKAKYNTETGDFELSGDVLFTKPDTVIRGDKLVIYQEAQHGYWEGNVKVIQQQKKNKKEDIKKKYKVSDAPVILYCDRFDFYWGDNLKGIAEGHVEAHQKDNHLYSDKAQYKENPQELILEGNVELAHKKGASFKCDLLTLDIKEETVNAKGFQNQGGSVEITIPLKK